MTWVCKSLSCRVERASNTHRFIVPSRSAGITRARFRFVRETVITRSSYGGPRGVTYAEDHVARTIGICRVPAGSEIVVAGE
jgi:hypothetical protein